MMRYWINILMAIMLVVSSSAYARSSVNCHPDVIKKRANEYDRIIHQAARQYGIEAALIHAVIKQESCYDYLAVSHAGAKGLMQLIPATAQRFNVKNAFNPKDNILGGAQYLAWLLKRFKGNIRYTLAGYNAGEGKVDRYKGIPPYRETRQYVGRVVSFYQQLKAFDKQRQQRRFNIASNKKAVALRYKQKRPVKKTIAPPNRIVKTHVKYKNNQRLERVVIGKRIRLRSVNLTPHQGYVRIVGKNRRPARESAS